jgi:hypothetical protein|nr:MAG TPA: hypothetical protein [Caudoviricetes sp.]
MKNKKYDEKLIKEAVSAYQNGMRMKDCSEEYKIPERTLARYAKEHKVSKKAHVLEKEIIDNAINDYIFEKMTVTDCARKYNIGISTLLRYININNVQKNIDKTHKIYDKEFFKNIDNEEKAYWLGFIAADGCIYKHNNSYCMTITLQERDGEHLNKLISSINGNNTIYRKENQECKLSGSINNYYKLDLNSKEIYHDLMKYGVSERKSSVLSFPHFLNKDLIRHYLRGYLDGDGWITTAGKEKSGFQYYITGMIATKEFCEELMDYLYDELGISKVKLQLHSNFENNNMCIWKKKGTNQIRKILDFLYKDANIYLDRKYNKYLEFCRLETRLQESQEN